MLKFNYLIIGSGIAGLTYAAKMATARPDAKIAVVTKAILSETNTRYAQGGIAVVTDALHDSFEAHIKDTLLAGDLVNDPEIVEMVVKEAPQRLAELIKWGAAFDRDKSGNLNLNLEGGHTGRRILHHKDFTGLHLENVLLRKCREQKNIYFLEKYFAIDLLVKNNECYGAEIVNMNTLEVNLFYSDVILLASGGAGQMYEKTTNPVISTGDGVAMAKRAGAQIKDMQYVQFHPTAFYEESNEPAFLISEAVRGFGAVLRNNKGEDFVKKYDERGSLASRDIVSRAIYFELQETKYKHVWLDCRHLNLVKFKELFPTIFEKCLRNGMDLHKDMIPVVPAAHYICGGIEVNENGLTNINRLYAIGECACTGLHGANRLASNSLLEAVVFAHRAFVHSKNNKLSHQYKEKKGLKLTRNNEVDEIIRNYRAKLQHSMMLSAGIVKTNSALLKLSCELKDFEKITNNYFRHNLFTIALLEFRNLVKNCAMVVEQSLLQKKNKGSFFNSDSVAAEVMHS